MIVIDASAGFEMLTSSSKGDSIRESVGQAELVIAPDLYVCEIANICWKAFRRKELSNQEATTGLRMALSIVDQIKPSADLVIEALKEAIISGLTVYDLSYLVLARREGASLLTIDKGMIAVARKMGVEIK